MRDSNDALVELSDARFDASTHAPDYSVDQGILLLIFIVIVSAAALIVVIGEKSR